MREPVSNDTDTPGNASSHRSSNSYADRNARTFAVNALTLPEPDVADFLEENARTPELVLEPGGGIDILVNVQDPPGESDFASRVRQNIIARYQEAGINVVQGHSLVMSITGSSGSTGRTMKFGSIAGGLGSEIAAELSEKALLSLYAPIGRVTGYDTIVPYPKTEHYFMPGTERIVDEIHKAMEYH